jgi:hypothetical protein
MYSVSRDIHTLTLFISAILSMLVFVPNAGSQSKNRQFKIYPKIVIFFCKFSQHFPRFFKSFPKIKVFFLFLNKFVETINFKIFNDYLFLTQKKIFHQKKISSILVLIF